MSGKYDVVIVDNGSEDGTIAAIKGRDDYLSKGTGPGVRILKNPELRHYSRSINMGAAAPGDWDELLVLNNDTIVTPGSIEAMATALSEQIQVVLPHSPASVDHACPKLKRPANTADIETNLRESTKWWQEAKSWMGKSETVRHPYVAEGGYAFMIARKLWEELGGFDESYTLFGQDYDLFDRATRRTKLFREGDAFIDHMEHQTCAWIGEERDELMGSGRFLLAEKREGLKELVSVIIPTYNRADALVEALESVLRQTMPHWKAYVIDDGSRDWDRIQQAAVRRFGGNESRIWFFHSSKNQGPGAARNRGLRLATGKYVAFLDSDDIWYPKHLETHLNLHESSPNLLMSYSKTDFAWRYWDDEFRKYRYKPDSHPEKQLANQKFDIDRLQNENFIKTSSTFFWGGLFHDKEALRFESPEDHRSVVEDWDLFRKVACKGEIQFIDKSTGRTHWAKDTREEGHHSARLTPWAQETKSSPSQLSRVDVSVLGGEGQITIVVPTRSRPAELSRCLEAIGEGPPIVIAADGWESRRYALAEAEKRPATGCLYLINQMGPSEARNEGAGLADTEWIWFLDDDDLPLPGWQSIEKDFENADVVIGKLLASATDGLKTASGVYTSAIFFRNPFFQKSGGFTGIFAEERDLISRLETLGARIVNSDVLVAVKTIGAIHERAASSPRGNGRPPIR